MVLLELPYSELQIELPEFYFSFGFFNSTHTQINWT